jgi:hypothetical protein
MKLILLFFVSLAAPTPLDKRQLSLAGIINSLPSSYILHPLRSDTAKPQVRSTATRKLIRYGPFKLSALQGDKPVGESGGHAHGTTSPSGILDILLGKTAMDPAGITTMRVLPDSMCSDCTVLSGRIDAVFDNGTRAGFSDGVYLHHAVVMNLNKTPDIYIKPPTCGNQTSPKLGGGISTFIAGGVVS